jgi:LmbE family N-acetylglucosaminyl deacetylase
MIKCTEVTSDDANRPNGDRPVVAFLFAHQDDEVAVFSCVEQAIRRGNRVLCIFLTNGSLRRDESARRDAARRDAESRRVLTRLGVEPADTFFVGSMRGIPGGTLVNHLNEGLAAISEILDPLPTIRVLYMHAWEGGHQDHDAVHLIGATYAAKTGLLDIGQQFPFYRAATKLLWVAVFSPLAENGPIIAEPICWHARLRYLRLSLCYPSQWKSWAGLFPLLAHAYGTKGKQETQGLLPSRLSERPHVGRLLYERRGHASYEDFRSAADAFLRAQMPAGAAGWASPRGIQ